jgi:hypothetical protein
VVVGTGAEIGVLPWFWALVSAWATVKAGSAAIAGAGVTKLNATTPIGNPNKASKIFDVMGTVGGQGVGVKQR